VVVFATAKLKVCAPRASFELSTTPIVKSNDPAALGFPAMLPVVAFKLRPGGKEPDRTENWYGEVPPWTDITALYAVPWTALGSVGEIAIRVNPRLDSRVLLAI
jgi:hypothetical protein